MDTIEGEVIKAADVPVYQTSIATFSKTAALLAELTATYKDKKYEVTTTSGMEEARKARATIREVRYALEKFRKQEKADILARGKAIDTDAKYLEEHLVAIEDPIHAQIKAEEDRKEAEKAERERVEAERVARIRGLINKIKQMPLDSVGAKAAELRTSIEVCKSLTCGKPEYEEFTVEAEEARTETLLALTRMLGAAELLEQQQADIARQQAELEAQRTQQQETERRQRAEAKRLEDAAKPPAVTPEAKRYESVEPLPPAAVPAVKQARTVHFTLPPGIAETLPWRVADFGRGVVSKNVPDPVSANQEYYGGLLIFESCSLSVSNAIVEVMNQLA